MPELIPVTHPEAREILRAFPRHEIKAEAQRRTRENGEPFIAVRNALARQWYEEHGIDPGEDFEKSNGEG